MTSTWYGRWIAAPVDASKPGVVVRDGNEGDAATFTDPGSMKSIAAGSSRAGTKNLVSSAIRTTKRSNKKTCWLPRNTSVCTGRR